MVTIWSDLRSWRGSQDAAFEALCCQLAESEQVPIGALFIRKAAPDAGLECLWRLPNGDEWGWQSKYFQSPPESSQWNQIDNSVKKALEKHPRLTRYTICLPQDRQDPRVGKQDWFMDKWDQRVQSWTQWAQAKGMSTEFLYWGEHEIISRLALDVHRGRNYFWFNREFFNELWFADRLKQAIADAGPRYTPELNIELPIARAFEGLGRTSDHYDHIVALNSDLVKAYKRADPRGPSEVLDATYTSSLTKIVNDLSTTLDSLRDGEVSPIPREAIVTLSVAGEEAAWQLFAKLEETQAQHDESQANIKRRNAINSAMYSLRQLARSLAELATFFESEEAMAAAIGAIILLGDAGTGKTHLICDAASRRVTSGLPTIVLHGKWFIAGEPWKQILENLGLACSREEFLGALEAAAQATGRKALILVDALNESEDRQMWANYFGGALAVLARYPWIGLAVSARTSYEDLIIPEGLVPTKLIRIEHHGFADKEYEAAKAFFEHFQLELPSIPPIAPEFRNPLFLKLFCITLKNQGLTRAPTGLSGFTSIFRSFIDSVNRKLSRPEYLNFDSLSEVVQKAVRQLVQLMIDSGRTWVLRDQAIEITSGAVPSNGFTKSLFWHLISEGVIIEDRIREVEGQSVDCVRFSYERFSDHLVVDGLLDLYLDPGDASNAFALGGSLHYLIQDETSCYINRGMIDALSVQLPERAKRELGNAIPNGGDWRPVRLAFVNSVIWRNPVAISDETLTYINKHVAAFRDSHDAFLDALLTVTSVPEHPFNADFLNKHLARFEMVERDAWWSTFVHREYGSNSSLDRLIDWAWSNEDRSHVSEEVIRLCGIALTWFLTSSNRFLRDRTTKALVSILQDRPNVLCDILAAFRDVNDPYVAERLYAVAYGSAMRHRDKRGLQQIASLVYELVFKDRDSPPHILLRDYAFNIVNLAIKASVDLAIQPDKLHPPYKSEWPADLPTKEALAKQGQSSEGMPDEEWARVHLYQSIMGFEDFARYILGTDHPFFSWFGLRLNETLPPTLEERANVWEVSLTRIQRKLWDNWRSLRTSFMFSHLLKHPSSSVASIKTQLEDADKRLRKSLGVKKSREFEAAVIPFLTRRASLEHPFDISELQRFIFKRVLDFGWTVPRFGKFDRSLVYDSRYGRTPHKPERIGKKYQWIAYHEGLARIADNFKFRKSRYSNEVGKYEGAWQLDIRDIDPSLLLRKGESSFSSSRVPSWWVAANYRDWNPEDHEAWLGRVNGLPSPEKLIEVVRPTDESTWLTLHSFYGWEQQIPKGMDRYERPTQAVWYILNSYLLKAADIEEFLDWAKSQNFMGRWMPESKESHDVFIGEFHWSLAFHDYLAVYYDGPAGWTEDPRLPKQVYIPVNEYTWSGGHYDCSLDDSISIRLPAKLLTDKMGLSWNRTEGQYVNDSGELVVYDPSIEQPGPGALLVRKADFIRFLTENNLGIVWTVLGEKNVIGDGFVSKYSWPAINGAYTLVDGNVTGTINVLPYGSKDN